MSHPQPIRAVLALSAALLCASQVQAHGYLSQPEARGLLCKSGANTQCGAVQWEPQSLEGPSGFPARGPADGTVAAAGLTQFAPLNEQSASRWAKRAISAGPQTFTWTFTANHVTRNFRYYLTKPDWNPNQALSRSSFEEQPFCQQDGGMRQPPKQLSHNCQLPARRGYQVMMAVWEVGDTPMSFYNVIDLMFQDGSNPPTPVTWAAKGMLFPSVDLAVGDVVSTRVFDERGERQDLRTRLRIASTADGQRETWPYLLAGRINVEQTLLRAGQRGADGNITPVPGRNEVFVSTSSGLQRVEVQIDKAPPPSTVDLLVGGLPANVPIVNGQASVSFSVTAVGEMEVSATLLNHGGQTKGVASASLNNNGQTLRIVIDQPQPGHHQLVVKGQVKGSGELLQKTLDLMLTGSATDDSKLPRFPEGLKAYKAGTRVLQAKTGATYECRPWPNSGFCTQWSPGATHYEPGVGSHWREAWVQR